MNDKICEFLKKEYQTQEERSAAVHVFLAGYDRRINEQLMDDLASWILFGIKGTSVKTQIILGGYECKHTTDAV